jgi:hypothetical protein
MLRLILAAFFLFLVAIAGLAIALNYFFGWKGLIAFPFILIALLWVSKIIIGKLFQRLLLRLFSMKSRVLRGAKLRVHSITAVAKPVESSDDSDVSDSDLVDVGQGDDEIVQEEPSHYFDVDMTITPKESEQVRVWEPGELILTTKKLSSLADLEAGDHELGTAGQVLVWDGSQFGPDDPGKYPGEQRLKITFATKPNTSKAWLHYYDVPIGLLELPPWKP